MRTGCSSRKGSRRRTCGSQASTRSRSCRLRSGDGDRAETPAHPSPPRTPKSQRLRTRVVVNQTVITAEATFGSPAVAGEGIPPMSLPAREPPPSADASLPLRFDDSDRDLLARAFGSPGDGPRAWRLNGEAHRISLVDGFDRLLAWPVLHGVTRYDHQERTALRVLRDLRGRAILADEVGLGKTIEAGAGLPEEGGPRLLQPVPLLHPAALTGPGGGGRGGGNAL